MIPGFQSLVEERILKAQKNGIEVTVIGTQTTEGVKIAKVETEDQAHKMMETLLRKK